MCVSVTCFPACVQRTACASTGIITGAVAGLTGWLAGKACLSTRLTGYVVCLARLTRVSWCCRLKTAELSRTAHVVVEGISLFGTESEIIFLCWQKVHFIAGLFHSKSIQGGSW